MSGREVSPETSGALRRGGRAMHFRPTPQVSNVSNLGFQPGDLPRTPVESRRDERIRAWRRAQIASRQGRKKTG